MLIALVSDCYLPRLGGIEVQVADLAAQLRAAGHTVLVITATAGPRTEAVVRLSPPLPLGVPINPWAAASLRSVLAGADVVHIHLGVLAPFAHMAAEIATDLAKPTVLTWHSLVGDAAVTSVLARSWRSWVTRGALPTAVSRVAADQVASALGLDLVALLRNGIDLSRWRDVVAGGSRAPRVPQTALRDSETRAEVHVVSAMRFAVRKRPLRLISMLATVRSGLAEEADLRLTVLGDGPWLRPLRAVVARSSLRAWVELPGRVSRAELLDRYRSADLYLAPSRREAFGIAALEARTAGLPVAGYADCGLSDIVEHGVGGVLARDDADLVTQLCALLPDRARLQDMAGHHRDHPLHEHEWSQVTAATLATYERAYRGVGTGARPIERRG